MGIPIAFIGADNRLVNCLISDAAHDGPLKRAQAIAGVTDFGVDLCRWILKLKFSAQMHALDAEILKTGYQSNLVVSPKLARAEIQNCASELSDCDTQNGFLSLEGRAAGAYGRFLAGRALPWPAWTHRRIPAHWLAISPRERWTQPGS
jgi:CRISPR/Cas system-associated endonuclease Cas1